MSNKTILRYTANQRTNHWLVAILFFMAGLYLGGNRYEIHLERLADFSATARGERAGAIDAALRQYVAALERHVRDSPWNWFNFYDFWPPR